MHGKRELNSKSQPEHERKREVLTRQYFSNDKEKTLLYNKQFANSEQLENKAMRRNAMRQSPRTPSVIKHTARGEKSWTFFNTWCTYAN